MASVLQSFFSALRNLPIRLYTDEERGFSEIEREIKIVAVNFHFTRMCNYACGFCFHTAKTSHVESLENALRIIRMLRDKGCEKINFAGGEPFLPQYRSMLGEMVKFSKVDCKFPSVSIISNGVYVTREWFERYSQYLDILGISCDSVNEDVNQIIGRGKGDHIKHVRRSAALCHEFGVMFKMNTVVNRYNWDEDLSDLVQELKPFRWKIFQVLPLEGENKGPNALRDVNRFLISSAQFEKFVNLHRSSLRNPSMIKVENNAMMQASYILVDEHGRFLDSSTGGKQPTASMLEVGIDEALRQLGRSAGGGFDSDAFARRDGAYRAGPAWSRPAGGAVGGAPKALPDQGRASLSDLACEEEMAACAGPTDIEDLGRAWSAASGARAPAGLGKACAP